VEQQPFVPQQKEIAGEEAPAICAAIIVKVVLIKAAFLQAIIDMENVEDIYSTLVGVFVDPVSPFGFNSLEIL